MKRRKYLEWATIIAIILLSSSLFAYEVDVISTPHGDLKITFIGHASVCMEWGGKVIHIDPVGRYGDYSQLPKADLILITHEHYDHFDPRTIEVIRKKGTIILTNTACARYLNGAHAMKNGDERTFFEIKITALPAYNIVHLQPSGVPYHPKGEGNGYLVNFKGTRVYIGGDTENIPEMKALRGVDIAFLPMNLPYTMTPEMVADAARAFRPRILYPYHLGDTDVSRLIKLLKDEKGIDVRIRKMK
ncbi:MAG TPA: MBL fold metallo-hydrolase [Syntrophales bacterium]|nr:MBL fold metallo-hydrolase [Syntrophales bacterium]HOL58379.1 MBL fold metallo-hydrolase [Syntrophales bacterium]HPO34548.1 MBL fold metallo-hydrolase [Syntrophales bacterium]